MDRDVALTSDLPGPHRQAEDELPPLLNSQRLRVPVPVFVAAIVIAALAFDGKAPTWLWASWLVLEALALVLRGLIIHWAARQHDLPIKRRMNAIALVSAFGGGVHGLSVLFWPYLDNWERAVQSIYLLGLCAGSVATVFGYRRVFLAYMLPMLLPLAVTWSYALGLQTGGWYRGAAGVMVLMFCLYGGLLMILARDTFRLFQESFDARQRLAIALREAEAANRAKTRFLAAASHDLRQPMHTLALFAAALSMRPLDEGTRAITTQMNSAMQAINSQLDALLDISKLDAGVVVARPTDVHLNELCSRLASEFTPLARKNGLACQVSCPEGTVVRSDPLLLERVLRNLLDNAVKYTRCGSIHIQVDRKGDRFDVRVRDTGPGIAEADQERIFEEFYQLGNPERDRMQGLGLGLSIVKRLDQLLGLNLKVRSSIGRGTEFVISLPASAEMQIAKRPPSIQSPASLRGVDVLVVDNEEAIRDAMRTLLESSGCTVRTVASTDEALSASQIRRPDVVLADFRLRDEDDGITTVSQLRQLQPGLPAILISGDTAPERLQDAEAAGLRLLHKPVQPDMLLAVLGEAVGRKAE